MTATISPKFQIVIPKEIREPEKLRAGMKVAFVRYRGHIELIPLRPLSSLRGAFPDLDMSNIREKKDRDV